MFSGAGGARWDLEIRASVLLGALDSSESVAAAAAAAGLDTQTLSLQQQERAPECYRSDS